MAPTGETWGLSNDDILQTEFVRLDFTNAPMRRASVAIVDSDSGSQTDEKRRDRLNIEG
jgi:hypothetical protein